VDTHQLAKILWDYNRMEMPLEPADLVLTLGSHDTRVAERAVEVYHSGLAPLLVFSGGLGRLTQGVFPNPEAEVFADVAVSLGVPREKILIENQSTNTGENIVLTRKLLLEKGLHPQKIIIVQKPYMLRRAYATAKKRWPEMTFLVTGPQIEFENYPNELIPEDLLINIMVGDTQRIKLYAEHGFQIPQTIPDPVWEAYEELIQRGYTHHLITAA
jgi:uncharacterized SAM-binding protein YcdF (DUF218 family)